jgi:hypothetical protein
MTRFAWAVGLVGLLAPSAAADADLTKIDRTIRKEPAYRSGAPKYCLLAFGPKAKTRVWLVLDGDTLYVDRNGDGDLTGAGEAVRAPAFKTSADDPFCEASRDISVGDVRDGHLTYANLTINQMCYRKRAGATPGAAVADGWQDYVDKVNAQTGDGVTYSVSIDLRRSAGGKAVHWFAWLDSGGHLVFGGSPKTAPVVHFGGPLTMLSNPGNKIVHAGVVGGRFTVHIGTAGVGAGSFAYMNYDEVPKDVYPAIDVVFPPKFPGGKPVRENFELRERC